MPPHSPPRPTAGQLLLVNAGYVGLTILEGGAATRLIDSLNRLNDSRERAVKALLLNQMIDDPDIAPALLDEYLEAERAYLPQFSGTPTWL